MRPRQSVQSEAVSRRLELLSAELRSVNNAPAPAPAAREVHTRIRPGGPSDPSHTPSVTAPAAPRPAPSAPGPSDAVAPPPPVPTPGRHAARRRTQVVDLSAFRGRIALTPAHVAVFAVLVAVGLAVTTWWVLRDDPGRPVAGSSSAPPLTTPVDAGTTQAPVEEGATSQGTDTQAATELVIDVAGKVRSPGIVVLEPGSRVVDAIEAAGGPRRGVDLTSLNLARPVQDGEQILVGVAAPPGVAASSVPGSEGDDAGGGGGGDLININTASATELEELSGVGPVTAGAIIDWRTSNGRFQSVDQLLEVDGIGEKTLAQLAPHVTVG